MGQQGVGQPHVAHQMTLRGRVAHALGIGGGHRVGAGRVSDPVVEPPLQADPVTVAIGQRDTEPWRLDLRQLHRAVRGADRDDPAQPRVVVGEEPVEVVARDLQGAAGAEQLVQLGRDRPVERCQQHPVGRMHGDAVGWRPHLVDRCQVERLLSEQQPRRRLRAGLCVAGQHVEGQLGRLSREHDRRTLLGRRHQHHPAVDRLLEQPPQAGPHLVDEHRVTGEGPVRAAVAGFGRDQQLAQRGMVRAVEP